MAKKKPKTRKKTNTTSSLQKYTIAVTTISNKNSLLWLSVLLLIATVVAYYPNHGGDYDIWWHLKYGEHFVNNLTWNIDHTVYSWTPTDGEWKYVTWLGSSLLYLIYSVAAYPGLHILQMMILIFTAIYFLYYLRCSKDTFSVTHAACLLLVYVAINPTAIFIKPELFTVFFFSLIVLIYFISKLHSKNLFFLYPILFLFWVNTHGGFVIGLFFISLILFFETGNYLFIRKNNLDKSLLLKFSVFVALSYVVLIINPHGVSYPLETITRMLIGGKSHQNIITAYINRWQYLFPDVYVFRRTNTAWALVFMQAAVLAAFVYGYVRKRLFDVTLIVVNIVFFLFSMQMARATLYFPLIWLFSMQYILRKSGVLSFNYRAAPAAFAVMFFVSGVCIHNTVTTNTFNSWFGSKLDESVPFKEVEFIRDNNLPGPLFNDYLTGGYMIWSMYPEYKVFIDPRHRPYEKSGVWEDYVDFRMKPDQPGLDRFTSKYPFKTALIHHIKYGELVSAFFESPEWGLLYFDKIAAVFVHRSTLSSLNLQTPRPDLGTKRFNDLSNPTVLYSLFKIYYLIDLDKAREIAHIYENNVSNLYINKIRHLKNMNEMLARG